VKRLKGGGNVGSVGKMGGRNVRGRGERERSAGAKERGGEGRG